MRTLHVAFVASFLLACDGTEQAPLDIAADTTPPPVDTTPTPVDTTPTPVDTTPTPVDTTPPPVDTTTPPEDATTTPPEDTTTTTTDATPPDYTTPPPDDTAPPPDGTPEVAPPVDACATDNGGCGNPAHIACADGLGTAPTCTPIDACATDNGGCGAPAHATCSNGVGRAPTCSDIDECSVDNGGCGSLTFATCANNPAAPPTCVANRALIIPDARFSGVVRGIPAGRTATVILGNDRYLTSKVVADGDAYAFSDMPAGDYFLKVEGTGLATPPTKALVVADGTLGSWPAPSIDFETGALANDLFTYHWEQDLSRAGSEQTAYINKPHDIQFLGQAVPVPDLATADTLLYDYNIILSDEELPWNQEDAYRFLETMKTIPQATRWPGGPQTFKPTKWTLTEDDLAGDLEMDFSEAGASVRLAAATLVYAAPKLVLLGGLKGNFYSKRLHHALARFVTRDGTDLAAVEKILTTRFGCTTVIPDYAALTALITAEDADSFQPFHPAELVAIISTFEEMPKGYHAITGLKYLVRRKDGMPHPWYREAPAVAWALPSVLGTEGYVEFMESGFNSVDTDYVHRLLIHEKSHFLWSYVFSDGLRQEWMTLGGWYPDPDDPDGWSTTQQTEFVSAYAHKKNPNEDMAESLSYFIMNPDALRSRSLPKYEFIRDRIMHGNVYLAMIQADLTFQVLNLFPDYTYPGKINRIDIRVEGAPEDDKVVTIEVGLALTDETFGGAAAGHLRLFSEIGTFVDLWLGPQDAAGSVLRGTVNISKYAKAGLWRTDQIVMSDSVGNQRMEGVHDYGWRMYLDNPLEDLIAPRYVPGSLTLSRFDDVYVENGVEHPVQRIHASWQYVENRGMPAGTPVHASLTTPELADRYSMGQWGDVDPETQTASIDYVISQFWPTATYGLPFLMMYDLAGNIGDQRFSNSPQHKPLLTVPIVTSDPDLTAPEVSLNDDPVEGTHKILVSAEPTHPEAPNGETIVTIVYQARDDKSGVGQVYYSLVDPQGLLHSDYHYHANFHSMFFDGDPTAWTEYTLVVVLPVGSAPGTWGLKQLSIMDKVRNMAKYDFTEIVAFELLTE